MPPPVLPADHSVISIEKLKTGDLSSFQLLYRLYHKEFVVNAEEILKDKAQAPSLVKHCFIKCWLRSSQLTSMNYTIGFLNLTIRNNCLAYNNFNGYRSPHFDHILKTILSADVLGGDNISENFNRIIIMSADELALAKEVFGRFYTRRMTIREVADELGLSSEYVQQRISLAFNILHHLLA